MLSSVGRALVLGTGATACISRGASYLTLPNEVQPCPTRLAMLEGVVPLEVWAGLWLGLAALLFAALVWDRLTLWAMSIFTGLLFTWGLMYYASGIINNCDNGWLSGSWFITTGVWSAVFTCHMARRQHGF